MARDMSKAGFTAHKQIKCENQIGFIFSVYTQALNPIRAGGGKVLFGVNTAFNSFRSWFSKAD